MQDANGSKYRRGNLVSGDKEKLNTAYVLVSKRKIPILSNDNVAIFVEYTLVNNVYTKHELFK